MRNRILDYLFERIEGCKNPRHFGELLKANRAGLWRYRVGDFRVICAIQDDRLVVLAIVLSGIGGKCISRPEVGRPCGAMPFSYCALRVLKTPSRQTKKPERVQHYSPCILHSCR